MSHHHIRPKLPNDDIEIFLKRDERGAIIPVDRYGRHLSGVRSTTTTYAVDSASTVTVELFHCGWFDDIHDKTP